MVKSRITRRSFFTSVTGGTALAFGTSRAGAQTYTGVTDADTGAGYDYPGYGRSAGRQTNQACSGYTDSDTGANYDPIGCGRQAQGRTCSGATDADTGAQYDPVGCGRGTNPQQPVGPSQSAECQAMRVQMDTLTERYAGYVYRFSNANQQFNYYLNLARQAFAAQDRPAYSQALAGLQPAAVELRTAFNGMTATEAGLTGLLETAEVFC
ncbi:hypothetical protein [Hyphobacterium sp.]|uniref:hypothetical protein n=1 Tax=Hyphobacterium sp. TaxID=2004662 RepID=UPI003BAC2E17